MRDNPERGAVAALYSCSDETCGKARTHAGHPRKGQIQVHAAGINDGSPWFCSWHCLSRYALRQELRE